MEAVIWTAVLLAVLLAVAVTLAVRQSRALPQEDVTAEEADAHWDYIR